MPNTLKERFRTCGYDAFGQFFLAVFSLIVIFTPLSEFLETPALWVASDVIAAIFILFILLSRDDWFVRMYTFFLFPACGLMALYMFFDGIIVAPVLFFIWCKRSYDSVKKGHSRAMGELVRSTLSIMAAGIPAAMAYAWTDSAAVTTGTLCILFFATNGWLYLYPPGEWLVDTGE